MIEFKNVMEHIEVWISGKFVFSADNRIEAERELKAQLVTIG